MPDKRFLIIGQSPPEVRGRDGADAFFYADHQLSESGLNLLKFMKIPVTPGLEAETFRKHFETRNALTKRGATLLSTWTNGYIDDDISRMRNSEVFRRSSIDCIIVCGDTAACVFISAFWKDFSNAGIRSPLPWIRFLDVVGYYVYARQNKFPFTLWDYYRWPEREGWRNTGVFAYAHNIRVCGRRRDIYFMPHPSSLNARAHTGYIDEWREIGARVLGQVA